MGLIGYSEEAKTRGWRYKPVQGIVRGREGKVIDNDPEPDYGLFGAADQFLPRVFYRLDGIIRTG